MAKPVVSQADKDYLVSALDAAIASCRRLASRQGQLPFAVDAYKKEGDAIASLRLKVASWDVT